MWTIRTLLGWCYPWLTQRGVESARLDSELLLAKALNLRRIDLFLDPHRPLTPPELAAFKVLVKRRAAREPVAYILGQREFWSLECQTRAGVLIPRPETELLVETILLVHTDRQTPLSILELGVGSGALLCALLTEYPQAHGIGTDLSPLALQLTKDNVHKFGLQDRVVLLEGDLDLPLPSADRFEIIMTNPPYIPTGELATLQPEVRN